jgi:hypothetical protein
MCWSTTLMTISILFDLKLVIGIAVKQIDEGEF